MITRKLHFSYLPKSSRIRVQVCKLEDVKRESKLLQSTDGPIAIEVHRPADKDRRLAWVATAEHHFQSLVILPWDHREAHAIAYQLWTALGSPDVGALVFSRECTFTAFRKYEGEGATQWISRGPGVLERDGEGHVFDAPLSLD